jgi:5-(aminomethyl)-3-furanmethanol phosphate kinase
MRSKNVTVVKLGGSHAGSAHLEGWLDTLAACGGRVVVVPGGGPFADAVRLAQAKMGFGDAAAHHMALLAMEQYGRALASLAPGLRIAASATAIRRALRDGRVPVWAPAEMVLNAPEIPASWDVTSDSLAAWLACQIGAKHLLLVKHGGPFAGRVRAAELVARDVVDRAFPRFLGESGAQGSIVAAPNHGAAAVEALRTGGNVGARIDLHAPDALISRPWPRSRRRAGAGR